jgi:hypothetical protein
MIATPMIPAATPASFRSVSGLWSQKYASTATSRGKRRIQHGGQPRGNALLSIIDEHVGKE